MQIKAKKMNQPTNKTSNTTYLFITVCFFLFVNLYFSNLLANKLASGWHYSDKLINLLYVQNTGAAFSILQNSTTLLIVFSFLALIAIAYFLFKNIDLMLKKEIFALSILLAGILGNLYERIHFGFVRDFFELTFCNFPIFNISDIFINIGVFGIIILIILTKKPIKLI